MRLVILFQRFLEARVVRSESDGSFTLTLSVPELERAFGKKFKPKTKYKTKTQGSFWHCSTSALSAVSSCQRYLLPFQNVQLPPSLFRWFSCFLLQAPLLSHGCTVSLGPVPPLSGTIWHLVPSPTGRRHLLSLLPSFSSFALMKAPIVDLLCSGFS